MLDYCGNILIYKCLTIDNLNNHITLSKGKILNIIDRCSVKCIQKSPCITIYRCRTLVHCTGEPLRSAFLTIFLCNGFKICTTLKSIIYTICSFSCFINGCATNLDLAIFNRIRQRNFRNEFNQIQCIIRLVLIRFDNLTHLHRIQSYCHICRERLLGNRQTCVWNRRLCLAHNLFNVITNLQTIVSIIHNIHQSLVVCNRSRYMILHILDVTTFLKLFIFLLVLVIF